MSKFNVSDYLERNESELETVETGPNILPTQGSPDPRGSIFGALMRQENTIGSALTNKMRSFSKSYTPDPEFNWADNVPEGYFDFAPRFALAKNKEQISAIRFQIDLENQDKALIGAHPIQSLFTGFIVNALDPTSLLPGTAIYKGSKASLGALRTSLNTASAAFVSTIPQEYILQRTQYNRTLEESGMNLLSSTFLGAGLGAAAGKFLNSPNGKKAVEDVARVMDDGRINPDPKVGDTPEGMTYEGFKKAEEAYEATTGKSVGAAFNPEINPEAEELLMPKGVLKAYGATLGRLTPLTRGLTSPFAWVRNTTTQLLENDLFQRKNTAEFNFEASDHALETIIRHDRLAIDKHMADYEDVFYEMNGFKKGQLGRSVRHFLDRNKTISWDDFEQNAWLAVVRDGSENPHFAKAGRILKDKIFEPWKERMIEIGELPPNVEVKTALGYFTRVYNIDKINDPRFFGSWEVDNPETIYTIAKNYVLRINDVLKEQKPKLDARVKEIEILSKDKGKSPEIDAKIVELEKSLKKDFIPDLFNSKGKVRKIIETDLEAKTTIENIIDNVRGLNDNRYNNPLLRGVSGTGAPNSTKNRHWLIPDEEIAPFLVTSPSKVVPMFARGVISHYHITKWAKENGFDTKSEAITGRFDKVLDEYKTMLREAVKPSVKEKLKKEFKPRLKEAQNKENPETWTDEYRAIMQEYVNALKEKADPKYAAYLTKRFNEAENDIKDILSVLMGVYGQGENIVDSKAAAFAKHMTAWNYLRMMGYMVVSSFTDPGSIVARHGIGRFVSEGLAPVAKELQGAKHNKNLLKDMMRCMESYKGHRQKSFADQEGLIQETGLFGKAFHYSTQAFNNISLMSYWTDFMQYVAGNVSISRTLRAIDSYISTGKLSEKERQRLSKLGIDEADFAEIHRQFKLHGGIEDGSYYINWAEWDTNTAQGLKSLNSFKYATLKELDATIIMPTIGDKPLFAKTSLGSILFQFKSFAFAATNKILISGLQRHDAEFAQGVISLLALGEMTYIISRLLKDKEIEESPAKLAYEALDRSGLMGILMEVPLTLQKVGLLPGAGTSRYNSRGWLGALGGPTLGTVEDITYLLNRFKNSDETPLTDKDADKILKLAPGNNIWYLDGINRNLGITKSLSQAIGFEESE